VDYVLSNTQSCGGKRSYGSQREAAEGDRRNLRAVKNKREKLEAYRCLSCRQWHLGHPARKNKVNNGTRKRYPVRYNGLPDEY